MERNKRLTSGVALLLGLGLFACSSDPAATTAKEKEGVVEIFSWWTSGGEAQALEAVLEYHKELHPKTTVINAAADSAATARTDLQERLAGGRPPDMFQANIGADLFKWVLFNQANDDESKVEDLSAMADDNGWRDAFAPAVVDALSYDGKLYAVPLNIHRENALFYNKAIFEEHNLQPPTTLEELHTVCDALQAEGVTPMSFGNGNPWPMSILVFENILLATAGPDFYNSYFAGQESADAPEIDAALDEFQHIWSYMNSDVNSLDWDQGVNLVGTGDAAMTVMGDWAKGYLTSSGLEAGVDFGQIPFPGTAGTFVFTADTFPLPLGAPNRAGAVELLKTLASAEGQNVFNPIKGSIPARTDIDSSDYDIVAQQTIEDFADASANQGLAKALSGLAPGDFVDPVNTSLKAFTEDGDKANVMLTLRNYYDLLQ
jgi:glucose/mannose transport system substrate-binding protein